MLPIALVRWVHRMSHKSSYAPKQYSLPVHQTWWFKSTVTFFHRIYWPFLETLTNTNSLPFETISLHCMHPFFCFFILLCCYPSWRIIWMINRFKWKFFAHENTTESSLRWDVSSDDTINVKKQRDFKNILFEYDGATCECVVRCPKPACLVSADGISSRQVTEIRAQSDDETITKTAILTGSYLVIVSLQVPCYLGQQNWRRPL